MTQYTFMNNTDFKEPSEFQSKTSLIRFLKKYHRGTEGLLYSYTITDSDGNEYRFEKGKLVELWSIRGY